MFNGTQVLFIGIRAGERIKFFYGDKLPTEHCIFIYKYIILAIQWLHRGKLFNYYIYYYFDDAV